MNAEHALAIQILTELGKSEYEIMADEGWRAGERPTLEEIERVLTPVRRHGSAHYLVFQNHKRTVREWSYITGLPDRTIFSRLRRGWSVADTLTKPIQPPQFIYSRRTH